MNYNNNKFKFILLSIIFAIVLFIYRKFSFDFGRITFRIADIYWNKEDILFTQRIRILYQFSIDIIFLVVTFLVSRNSRFKEIVNPFLVNTIILLPFLTDVSDIFYDKSCWKPWINMNYLIWYLPLRLTLWLVLYLFIRKNLINYQNLYYLISLFISVMIFTLIKPF